MVTIKDLPAEIRAYLSPYRPWAKIILIAVAGLVVCSWGGVKLYREAKVWRARSLASAVLKMKGSPDADIDVKLHAAYQLAPNDPAVVRACARYELAIGNPYGLMFYQQLITLPGVPKEDRREAARVFILTGDMKRAGLVVENLMAEDPEAGDLAVAAQYHWQQQERAMALDLMHRSVEMDPKDRLHQLSLAQMMASSGDKDAEARAVHLLQGLAGTPDTEGLQALMTLAQDQKVDIATGRDVLQQLRKHPLLDDAARFAAWNLEARLGDRDARIVLEEAVHFFQATALSRKIAAARWMLYNENQPALALELTPLIDAASSQQLLLIRLDALGDLNQWAEVDKELANPAVALPAPLVNIYRARAAQQSGHANLSPVYWDRARQEATTDKAMLLRMVDFALKQNLIDEAKKTYRQLTKIPSQSHDAYVALLHLETQQGTQPELLATLKDMMTDLPSDPQPKNDWAFLSLMLNTNVNEAWQIAGQLVREHPEMLAYRSTLALGDVRRNDSAAAEKVYDQIEFDWETTPDSWKLIRIIVMAANGRQDLARAYAGKIDRSHLRPEEQTLLQSYLPDPGSSAGPQ